MTQLAPAGTGVDPTAVKQLANSFCHAKLLLTANELGVFTDLHHGGPATAPQLAERLDLHPRGIRDLLHGLVLLGMLELDGDTYRNSALADATLVPGSPDYIGGFLRRADHMLYPSWGNLSDAIRTGRPQASGAGPDAFLRMLDDPTQRDQYLRMMDSANGLIGEDMTTAIDWSAHHTLVDVGGCRGNLSARLVTAHPHLRATVFDLPPMGPALAEHTASLGVADRVAFTAGDFFTDELPSADVLILGHVLHNWSPQQRRDLVAKAYRAVNPGGALLIYDAMLTEQPTDLARILVSINMLLVTEGGSEYTAAEGIEWLTAAGCTHHETHPLGTTDTLLIARKS